MAHELGFEYLGKGFDYSGNDGFILRKIGTSHLINIGSTQAAAQDWLLDKYKYAAMRKEFAQYAGVEEVMHTICQIQNVMECEIDTDGGIWINGNCLNDERTLEIWEHPLMTN